MNKKKKKQKEKKKSLSKINSEIFVEPNKEPEIGSNKEGNVIMTKQLQLLIFHNIDKQSSLAVNNITSSLQDANRKKVSKCKMNKKSKERIAK